MTDIRALHADDALADLTASLHLACARLGALGQTYTALDPDEATAARRLAGAA